MIFDTSEIRDYYINECRRWGEGHCGYPCICCVYNMDDPASSSFVTALRKTGEKANVKVEMISLSNSCRWEPTIQILNEDESVLGILLISPPHWQHNYHKLIEDKKNVEGNDYDDRIHRVSCTAQSILRIAADMIRCKCDYALGPPRPSHETHITDWIEGSDVAIVGYGKAVGKPLSYLFMRYHAGSVTTIHKYTDPAKAKRVLREANIIVSATGNPDIFESLVKPEDLNDKYIIDAGIAIDDDGTGHARVIGDIETEKFADNNMITKVPGGVGAVTTAMILHNTAKAAHGAL